MFRGLLGGALIGLAGASVTACDSGDGGGGASGIAGFAQQYAEVVCTGLVRCCASAGKPVEKSTCTQLYDYQRAEYERGASSGQYEFDSVAADTCLEKVRAVTDQCTAAPPVECDQVLKGTTAAGGRCEDDAECAATPGGTAECAFSGDEDQGKCEQTVRGQVGDTCQKTCEDLGNGTWQCAFSGEDAVNGILTACYRNDNVACYDETKKCVALGTAGTACRSDDQCARGFTCSFEVSQCVALVAVGGACTSSSACESQFCDPDDKCAPPLAVGAAYDPAASRDPCGADARCSDEGQCEARGLFGGGGEEAAFVCSIFGG
ncbi:MAG: hypothetical protein ACOYM9_03700 [Bradymonadia bacterium]